MDIYILPARSQKSKVNRRGIGKEDEKHARTIERVEIQTGL
jgi:hypothetical protein